MTVIVNGVGVVCNMFARINDMAVIAAWLYGGTVSTGFSLRMNVWGWLFPAFPIIHEGWNSCVSSREAYMLAGVNGGVVIATCLQR